MEYRLLGRTGGLGILAWMPMAMGVLVGRYSSAKDYPSPYWIKDS
jgi:hypothetical protein